MWANDVLDHLVIVRVVGVSLSGQRSLVLRPKALNVGAEGPQCLGRRPSVSGPKALRGECSVVGLPRAPHPSHCTRVTITLLNIDPKVLAIGLQTPYVKFTSHVWGT